MKKFLSIILAILIFALVHEGLHILVAIAIGEFDSFRIKPIGFEVIARTPIEQRHGIRWAFFSGVSNLATILLGYLLLSFVRVFAQARITLIRNTAYFLILFFLLLDPLNLSLGPFIYGGDIHGIAVGLNLHPYWLQLFFLVVFLINRELAAQVLLPSYRVETRHILFRPWLKKELSEHSIEGANQSK